MKYKPILATLFIFLMVLLPSISALGERITELPSIRDDLITSGVVISDSAMEYPAVEVKGFFDGFLWIEDKKADLVLTEHNNVCGENCISEFVIKTYEESALVDDIKFYRLDEGKNEERSIRSYNFQYYGDVPNYIAECKENVYEKNGSKYQDCIPVISGSHKGWIDYNVGDKLPIGTYNVKLLGKKAPYMSIDWVIKTQGKMIEEWATWGNISTGSQAEVRLNSPVTGSTQYWKNITTNASANVTNGAFLTNGTLYDNSTGTWGARNTTTYSRTNSGYVTIPNDFSNFNGETASRGMNFSISVAVSGITVVKNGSTTPLYAILRWANSTYINHSSFSGNNATILTSLPASNYLIVVDSNGAGYTSVYKAGVGYPITGTNISVINGIACTSNGFGANTCNLDSGFKHVITGVYGIGSGTSNNTLTSVNTFTSGQSVLWNYQFCDSDGACGFATSNRTFSIDSVAPTITLNYPTSLINYGAVNGTLQLNLTATDAGSISSLWYNYNGTNVTIAGAISGVANLSNITLSTKKNVTIYANDSVGNINSATYNWDYNFFENNRTYNAQTYETSHESYELNFNSALAVLSGTANFYYNGTLHSSTFTCSGLNCNVNSTLDIPLLTGATAENKSFYWEITTYDGINSYSFNTSAYTQTVNPLTLTSCTGTNVSMNFTAYDEQTRNRLSPFDFQGNFEYYTGLGTIHKDLIVSNTSTPYIALCLNVNTTYYIDSTISYAAPAYTTTGSSTTTGNATTSTTTVNTSFNYPTRTYYYQKYPISQITKNVSLLLLGSPSSTNFLLNVQDSALRPVNNVLIEAQRCYSGLNTTGNNNITAFISKTDISGYTSGNLEIYTGQYQFFITNQSSNLLSVTPCTAISPQSTPYTLTFKLGQPYQSPFINVENLTDITGSLIYNYTSHQVLMTYIDTSGLFVAAELIVKYANVSNITQTTICDTNNTLSSGIITCNISAGGSYTATGYVYRTDRKLVDQITFLYETNSSTLGYYGVFLGMFLLIIGAFAFKFNELAGIWLEFAIILFCNTVGLIAFGNVFITAYFCLALIISGVLER